MYIIHATTRSNTGRKNYFREEKIVFETLVNLRGVPGNFLPYIPNLS